VLVYQQKDEEFSKYVKKKTVALVGPAASLSGQDLGKKIDSYDIVARIKSFVREDVEDAGTRCDILYTTNPLDRCDLVEKKKKTLHKWESYVFEKYDNPIKIYKSHNIEWIVSAYPSSVSFAHRYTPDFEDLGDKILWRFCRSEPYFEAKENTGTDKIQSRPNAGFGSFLDIHSFEPKELFVCGLDFYRSMYTDGYQNALTTKDLVEYWSTPLDSEAHFPDAQYREFRRIVENSKTKITVDPWFSKVLADRSYDKMYEMKDV